MFLQVLVKLSKVSSLNLTSGFKINTNCVLDFLANGFKVREDGCNDMNGSGNTLVYAAWAEFPFGGSGVAQARAR